MIEVSEAQRLYAQSDAAHGFDHVLRVWQLASQIGEQEGADLWLLQAAALLHDIARGAPGMACHAEASALRARQVLADYPSHQVEKVAQIIREHRYRSGPAPSSLESRVLFDADKLDAIGAIGIARAFAYGGQHGQRLTPETWDSIERRDVSLEPQAEVQDHTPVHEYRLKLVHIADHLYTESSRRIARERCAYMDAFFARLQHEAQGLL